MVVDIPAQTSPWQEVKICSLVLHLEVVGVGMGVWVGKLLDRFCLNDVVFCIVVSDGASMNNQYLYCN